MIGWPLTDEVVEAVRVVVVLIDVWLERFRRNLERRPELLTSDFRVETVVDGSKSTSPVNMPDSINAPVGLIEKGLPI